MNKLLLIFNIIATVLLIFGLWILIIGCLFDDELLINIGLFGTILVYGITLLTRIWSDNSE